MRFASDFVPIHQAQSSKSDSHSLLAKALVAPQQKCESGVAQLCNSSEGTTLGSCAQNQRVRSVRIQEAHFAQGTSRHSAGSAEAVVACQTLRIDSVRSTSCDAGDSRCGWFAFAVSAGLFRPEAQLSRAAAAARSAYAGRGLSAHLAFMCVKIWCMFFHSMHTINVNKLGNKKVVNLSKESKVAGHSASSPPVVLERLKGQLEGEKDDAIAQQHKTLMQRIASMTASHERRIAQLQQQWDES